MCAALRCLFTTSVFSNCFYWTAQGAPAFFVSTHGRRLDAKIDKANTHVDTLHTHLGLWVLSAARMWRQRQRNNMVDGICACSCGGFFFVFVLGSFCSLPARRYCVSNAFSNWLSMRIEDKRSGTTWVFKKNAAEGRKVFKTAQKNVRNDGYLQRNGSFCLKWSSRHMGIHLTLSKPPPTPPHKHTPLSFHLIRPRLAGRHARHPVRSAARPKPCADGSSSLLPPTASSILRAHRCVCLKRYQRIHPPRVLGLGWRQVGWKFVSDFRCRVKKTRDFFPSTSQYQFYLVCFSCSCKWKEMQIKHIYNKLITYCTFIEVWWYTPG